MKLSGRPLLATRVDQPLYVSRGVDDRVSAAIEQGLNVLILGSAGTGKTSLLHHLEYLIREAGDDVCYVDGRRTTGLDDLLDEVRRELRVEAPRMPGIEGLASLAAERLPPRAPAERTLQQLARNLTVDQRAVIFLDSPDQTVAHALFGRLRDTVWQVPATWIVAADPSVESELRRPPADAFFDIVERLDAMVPEEAREVLERRGLSQQQAQHVALSSDASAVLETTPRTFLDRARRLAVEHSAPNDIHRREADFQSRLGRVSRAAAMLAAEMRGQGAASASDQELQRRMGWTRPRLTQVLKELEGAGLAHAIESSDGRAGRPRRLYEIVEP